MTKERIKELLKEQLNKCHSYKSSFWLYMYKSYKKNYLERKEELKGIEKNKDLENYNIRKIEVVLRLNIYSLNHKNYDEIRKITNLSDDEMKLFCIVNPDDYINENDYELSDIEEWINEKIEEKRKNNEVIYNSEEEFDKAFKESATASFNK